jgi:hypothetical protein
VGLGLTLMQREDTPNPPPPPSPEAKRSWLVGLSLHTMADDYAVFMRKAFEDTLDAAKVDYFITDAHSADRYHQQEDIERH